MNRRVLSGLLALALLVAAAVAVFAVASSFNVTSRAGDTGLSVASLTSTPSIPVDNDLARARTEASERDTVVASAIAAVEAADIEAILRLAQFELRECTPRTSRTGNTPFCESLGLPDGSSIEFFPEDVGFGVLWFLHREALAERLTQLLGERSPRLELIAMKEGNELVLSFTIDEGGDGLNWLLFGLRLDGDMLIRYIVPGASATPVFDYIRFEEENGGHKFDVLGASDELIQRVNMLHELDARCSNVAFGEVPTGCD